jgi:TatA/E family protein of Tat protein translocase
MNLCLSVVNPSPYLFALFDGLGGLEMLVIFVLALMLFGGKRLPEVAKGLGKSIREFKRAASGVEDEIRRAMDMDNTPHRRPPTRRPKPAVTAPKTASETALAAAAANEEPPKDPAPSSAPEEPKNESKQE